MRADNQAATAVNDTREIGPWKGKLDRLTAELLPEHWLIQLRCPLLSATG
jgi:hypothetical protein